MEKQVTGINLDELKKAREEMMADMGITPPAPQNYSNSGLCEKIDNNETASDEIEEESDSDEIKKVQTEETQNSNKGEFDDMNDEEFLGLIKDFLTEADDSDSSSEQEQNQTHEQQPVEFKSNQESQDALTENLHEVEQKQKTNFANVTEPKRNLSNYDVFAQFEINPAKTIGHEDIAEKPEGMIVDSDGENVGELIEENNYENESNNEIELNTENKDEVDINNEDLMSTLDDILDNLNIDNNELETDTIEENNNTEEDVEKTESLDDEKLDQKEEPTASTDEVSEDIKQYEEQQDVDMPQSENEPNFEDANVEIVQDEKPYIQETEQNDLINDSQSESIDTESFNFFADKQPEVDLEPAPQDIIEVENKNSVSNDIEDKLSVEDIRVEGLEAKKEMLPTIDPVNFVSVLSMQDFKSSSNFTFVLGKNENGNIVYENLKQCYNIAFFANPSSYELLNSMLLSFMLKNSASDFKLALCDGTNTNNFAYYESSKYLFDGKISKNEDEISETLTNIASELESRYRTLARFGVKNIDEYNLLAKNTNTPKLSEILVVVDSYFELMHSSCFEKIKSSLYQILRLGRIAGIYVIVVTNSKIEEDIINFNLPSRIGFKCSENDDSIAMIGEMGIDKLASSHEFLYSSINLENAQHLRQPVISDAIIKILIDNIEK